MRILHVFRAPLGGLFRHVVDVARGQVERGHAVGIFCDSTTGGARGSAALEELRPHLALGITRLVMQRQPHPRDAIAIGSLALLARRVRPDVLHGHGSKGGAFARLAPAPGAVVRTYTPHGGSFNYHPGTLAHTVFMRAEAILARRTDAFLFESDYVRGRFDAYVGTVKAPVRVVHNGISEAEYEPIARDPRPADLVYIGELRPAKGVETLIDALALIRREHGRPLTIVIVGSGPSEAELRARVDAAGLSATTTFMPPQPIRAALARGRVMVIPSLAESLPYVILEAAAAAQPLVSTNVGGIGEIFGPYADVLIRPNDVPVLAHAVLAKLDEPDDLRRERADALSREVHGRFRIDAMVDGMLDGYAAARAYRGIPSERG